MTRRLLPSLALAALVAPVVAMAQAAVARPDPDALARAVREIEELDRMRSGLASTFLATGAPADKEAFAAVCQPVGKRAMALAKETGWTVRQLAEKNRNPANAIDAEALAAAREYAADRHRGASWIRTTMDGRPGTRYLRRIDVEPSCLLCHGERDARPAFIREGYPADRAFGFAVGDLRGVYSVFIPDGP